MSHIQYTICRSGTYYYNRRVPKQAIAAYGSFIRHALSSDFEEASAYAERLTSVLDGAWAANVKIIPVDISSVIHGFKPKSSLLSEMAEEYCCLREIEQKPMLVALSLFYILAGDKDVSRYTREDAKLYVHHLSEKGNKTATIRRRISSLSAIFNYAYSELGLEKRNPFSRLIIKAEGSDRRKRGVFTNVQLKIGYDKALLSGSTVRLAMPILGETGCRLAEIIGMRLDDIDMKQGSIVIRPNLARRLKTRNSTRTLPLTGYAKLAIERAIQKADGEWLFPQYITSGKCNATHASNALNKWLKEDFDGLTAHCLRHSMRDRLRSVECPLDMIDQIGGWKSVGGIGVGYGQGYSLLKLSEYLELIRIRGSGMMRHEN